MSARAWLYILATIGAGVALTTLALPFPSQSWFEHWTFLVLTLLATLSQLFEAEAPGRQSFYPHFVFFFAGVLLLPESFFSLLIVIPHLIEWAKERWVNSGHLQAWYIQPFNIAGHWINGYSAGWVYAALSSSTLFGGAPSAVVAGMIAATVYVLLNHVQIGIVLAFARGIPLRESGVLGIDSLLPDLIMACLGYIVAVLWQLNPWLIVPALAPLVLMQRALIVPQLQQEARLDAKTGLWNARYVMQLFQTELERAQRTARPLTVVMADLDLLRNINNSYGHLAGDSVLASVGQIIRQTIREDDVAGRMGGEEFVIVLPGLDAADAVPVVERIRSAIATTAFTVTTNPSPIQVTMSFGIACFPDDATANAPQLLHEADVAVYQAKLKGRNRVVCADDVPHAVKLSQAIGQPYTAETSNGVVPSATAVDQVPSPVAGSSDRRVDQPGTHNVAPEQIASAQQPPRQSDSRLHAFVAAIISIGVLVTVFGSDWTSSPNLLTVGLLVSLAVLAELLMVNLSGAYASVSVSIAVTFAAGLIGGVPGAACVGAAIALINHLQHLRGRHGWHKTGFNWAVHTLAGSVAAVLVFSMPVPLAATYLLWWLVPTGVAGFVSYAVETGLVATGIGWSQGLSIKTVWRDQFSWLIVHYIVLCGLGLVLGVAYAALGYLGIVVFGLPIVMMRYSQALYVARTERDAREMQRMNHELAAANNEISAASQANHALNIQLSQLNRELFHTLGTILDARDPYVGGHAAKVADYAAAIGRELGLSADRVDLLQQAGFLHDLGKIAIAEHILHKPTKLTDEEYEYIKTHADIGANMIATHPSLRHLAPFVRHHHERWDGRGYPHGLAGEAIPLEARILNVCDSVEAMASDRPYHRGMPLAAIVAEVQRCAGTQFDPTIVAAFIRLVEREGKQLIVNSAQQLDQKFAEQVEEQQVPTSAPVSV